jgi:TolB-like protein
MEKDLKSDRDSRTRNRLNQFLGEMGRRRVWRTAFAYAAVVFVLLQLGEIVFPAFGAPDWAMRLLVVTSFLGFPLVLALAWAFDLTSEGIQRTSNEDGDLSASHYTGTTLPRLALLVVTGFTVVGVGWWAMGDTLEAMSRSETGTGGPSMAAARTGAPAVQVRSLAVLPLDDFSPEEGGEYFTAGFHEELVSQLSQIGSARVLSRTSVVQYDAAGKAMPTIAEELGVEGVVEGSVFRDGNRVRITVQLIHGPSDTHLWANSYDGTLEDAIDLQRTVAQAIAGEIQAELFPEDESAVPPTRVAASQRVQEEYLKGKYEQAKATPEALRSAIHHFEAAVEEDSSFAPAFAGLAGARLLLEYQVGDSVTLDASSEAEIVEPLQMAFRLDEDLPEARAVLLTLEEATGAPVGLELSQKVGVIQDSAFALGAEIALASTELGRQLHRVTISGRAPNPRGSAQLPERRLATAWRFQEMAEFRNAEAILRSTIETSPNSQAAWDALETLKATQKDFEGLVEVRQERLAKAPQDPRVEGSLEELQDRLATQGEKGFWAWRLEQLRQEEATGEKVSPVQVARAYVGLERNDEALAKLEEALKVRDRNLASLWTDPAWDSIRGDPRFRQILSDARRSRTPPGRSGRF